MKGVSPRSLQRVGVSIYLGAPTCSNGAKVALWIDSHGEASCCAILATSHERDIACAATRCRVISTRTEHRRRDHAANGCRGCPRQHPCHREPAGARSRQGAGLLRRHTRAGVDHAGDDVVTYRSGDSQLLVYRSDYAGTNQATAATWVLGDRVDDVVGALRKKGVRFEHYDNLPDTQREGDVHVGCGMRVAWFKDPDGNILNLVSG
jgi:hypothetical protein